jgi:hypothetical protein
VWFSVSSALCADSVVASSEAGSRPNEEKLYKHIQGE